jgi:hypothetical protein
MKLKSKLIAAAIALTATTVANAAIDVGGNGNGELFFSIWDANGSYTRSLETSIDTFQTSLGTAGNINLSWAADATFTSFLANVADPATLKWNVMATDTAGARRILTTYTLPEPATKKTNDVMRTAAGNVSTYLGFVNTALGATNDSVAVTAASTAWAGKSTFRTDVGGLLNVNNAGTLANNSFATGLGFTRIDAAASGIAASQYNEYLEGTAPVNVWLDASNTLHVAAIPEPETYALMLAGLGMLGFMGRRRLNNRV